MKSIVTGGAGFIGSHLVDRLVDMGQDVVVLDNFSSGRHANLEHLGNRVQIVECDLATDGEWSNVFPGVSWVFHLAAQADIVPSINFPKEYFHSNVTATTNVLCASKSAQVERFIYAASSSCYGIPQVYPTPEATSFDPKYPYALTKLLGEQLALHWSQVYGLPALAMRLFNVYGTRSRTSGAYGAVFGVFLAQKLAGKPFTVVGDGEQARDFTFVTDVVQAMVMAAESRCSGKAYNVGSGEMVTVNRVVELLGGAKVEVPKRPGEPDRTWADISQIRADIGWTPKLSIEEGVEELLRHIDYWRDAPVWTPTAIADATRDWFLYLGNNKI